ncbi:MAG: hypothetical protein V1824_04820 [archaeon]
MDSKKIIAVILIVIVVFTLVFFAFRQGSVSNTNEQSNNSLINDSDLKTELLNDNTEENQTIELGELVE